MIEVKRYGEWILVLVTIIAAFGWIFSKEAISAMPPLGFMGLRFFFAALILLPICIGTRQIISLTNLPKTIFSGCLQAINMILWIMALSFGGSLGEGSFIMSLSVLMIPLITWLCFKEKPLYVFWLSLPIAIIGLAFLTLSSEIHMSINLVYFFSAALMQAIFFIFSSKLVKKIAILPLTCIQLFCSGLCCLIISFLFEVWPVMISWLTLSWIVASIFIATSLRYSLQLLGQKYVPVNNAAIIMLLEPVFATAAGIIVYAEPMPWNKWLGSLLILIALLIYRGYVYFVTCYEFCNVNK